MNINKNTLLFNILRKIANKPNSTQRDMAKSLDISLGKLNYCLKALKEKVRRKGRNKCEL